MKKRNKKINIRLTQKEYDAIKEKTKKYNTYCKNRTDVLIKLIKEQKMNIINIKDILYLLININKNINQYSKNNEYKNEIIKECEKLINYKKQIVELYIKENLNNNKK